MCFYLECSYFYRRIIKYFFKKNENVMFYDLIYMAKGFRMRPKVRPILSDYAFFRSKHMVGGIVFYKHMF